MPRILWSRRAPNRDDLGSWPTAIAWGDGTIPRGDPRGFEYWRREPDAYQDGLLDELGLRLSAPRCFGAHEDDLGMAVWLEDVDDDGPEVWDIDDYREAARALGVGTAPTSWVVRCQSCRG